MRNERIESLAGNGAAPDQTEKLVGAGRGKLQARTAREIERRQIRYGILGRDFADGPSWSMLLALLEAQLNGRNTSIKDLYLAGNCPKTSAIRLVGKLESAGLVRREPDKNDKRRCFLLLTPKANALLMAYFDSIG
ncbi:MarR family transcriptional regulator [Parasphingopyxis marina]|uniref:Winged helix DNA-binding protein n=1 Tax=Parasphingopyxis marina TaxID=2761622 RepID=A0A842HXQ6_9SPHN|nr:MarR family transcriptional regulator [Parasphingopyxis marina]MBC2777121.1 winged helix DNA-binding protein [Parasphingopyxis marina]